MKRMGIAGIVIVLTFYMAMIYGNLALAWLGFAEVLFVGSSFLELLFLFGRCEVGMEISPETANQNEDVSIHLWSRQTGWIRPGQVSCRVLSGNAFFEKKKGKWLKADTDYLYHLHLVGNYEFYLEKIRVYDLTGLFYLTKRTGVYKTVETIPEICYIPVCLTEAVRNFFGESDRYDDLRPGNDPSELFAVREFQKGDRIQNIHWKLSAKADEWMVKVHSMPKACAVTILIDFRSKNPKAFSDGIMKLAAGLSFSLMDQNCPHFIAWYSQSFDTVVRLRVEDEESFYLFWHVFFREKIDRKADAEQIYLEKYRSERILHLLIVNGDLEIRRGQEIVGKAQEKNLRESMEKMEIVL